MRLSLGQLHLPLLGLLPLALTGCAMISNAPPGPEQGMAIQGRVYGGQNPLKNAQVYLFAANSGVFTPNTNGYGNPSKSLLTSVSGQTTLDTSGGPTNGDYFVTTDTNGNFGISSDYTCKGGQQVYLYALGGDPGLGSGTNSAAGLLAALGTCPGTFGSTGNSFPSGLFVVMNEVSTIATAYAFAGFATDATDVSSSGTPWATTGITNAFANVTNLETLGTGSALTTTTGGSSTVPQLEINTLANILASCVNSSGPSSTACSTLFGDAKSGGSTGTAPTDTATAAINMAHNPGANISALYLLSVGTPPFAPALTSAPNDFTMALNFSGGGISSPAGIAIDNSGDVWIADDVNPGKVTELSPLGVALNGSPLTGGGMENVASVAVDLGENVWVGNDYNAGSITQLNGSSGAVMGSSPYTGGGVNEPIGVAVDSSDDIWVANFGESTMGNVSKFTNAGGAVSGSGGYGTGMEINTAIAIDTLGNVWTTDLNFGSLDEVSSTGTLKSGFTGYGSFNNPTALAFDSANHVWVATHGSNVKVLTDTGTAVGTYTGGGLGLSQGIAIDGANNAWIVNRVSSATSPGLLSEFTNGGTALTSSTGYTSSTMLNPNAIAIDESGDVWVTNNNNSTVSEFIGAAAPVMTPLAVAVSNAMLGQRP